MLTKSVAEMTFSLAYILNVAFITLYHINEAGRRAGDVMSYASSFIRRKKSVRCGSLCNERPHLPPISATTESSRSLGAFRELSIEFLKIIVSFVLTRQFGKVNII